MRTFLHWTPRYLLNRASELVYRRLHPDEPWLTPQANRLLSSLLTDNCRGVEFGSGRSTLWFARRIAHLTSVEHDAGWHERVSRELDVMALRNVVYLHRDEGKEESPELSPYVQVADDFTDASLDFALVDGVQRSACSVAVLRKLRPGGVLVVDNVNWFLPHHTHSPASRGHSGGPSTPGWSAFLSAVVGWRRVWTSNGVTDTALFFKP